MEADTSWTGDFTSGLQDATCSESRLVNLAHGQHQMDKVGKPNVVIMTSDSYNCSFDVIVNVCIFHLSPAHNYSKAYKDDMD